MAKEKYLFRLVRFLLIISGLWPMELPNESKIWRVFYKIYYQINHVVYFTYPMAFGVALILDFGNNIAQALEEFSRMTFVILIIMKLNIIRSKNIKAIIELVSLEEINLMRAKDEVVRKIYQFHVGYCIKMVFVIVIFLYAAGLINIFNGFLELYKWHLTKNPTTPKPHIVPFWFPFDKDAHYIPAMAYEIWHIFQTLAINGAVQALINAVMVFLRANLKILQYHIRNFDKTEPEKNLKKLIIRHQELIEWVHNLDGSFKNILLLEYCVTSLQLATTLIQIIEGLNIAFNGTFFMHCLLQLFGLAWNANEILIESSVGLLRALYQSNWYNRGKKVSFLIYFMMMRCSRPLVMRIGPLGIMNLNAAISRAKLAYTCLSVLKVTTEE